MSSGGDRGSNRAALVAAENQRRKEARSKAARKLGFDQGEKIGGGRGAQGGGKLRDQPTGSVLSEEQKKKKDSEMKRKTVAGEENLSKKTLLGA